MELKQTKECPKDHFAFVRNVISIVLVKLLIIISNYIVALSVSGQYFPAVQIVQEVCLPVE